MATLQYQTNELTKFITSKAPTFLKKLPVQSNLLSDDQRYGVMAGKKYPVLRYSEPSNGYILVEFDYKAGIWYIYTKHWDIPWQKIKTSSIDWNDMSSLITPHFTLWENLRGDPRRIPTSNIVKENILKVMNELEKIRTDYGEPIRITSGYRPPSINKSVGGATKSRHIQGDAVDIATVSGNLAEFQKYVDDNWYGALGYGAQKGFIHIDCRNQKGWKTGGTKGPRWNY